MQAPFVNVFVTYDCFDDRMKTVEEKGVVDVDGVVFRRELEAIGLEATGCKAK